MAVGLLLWAGQRRPVEGVDGKNDGLEGVSYEGPVRQQPHGPRHVGQQHQVARERQHGARVDRAKECAVLKTYISHQYVYLDKHLNINNFKNIIKSNL
jgi:hypothetical protein